MTVTHIWDMHGGGYTKTPYDHIFIEASEVEAAEELYRRFGVDVDDVTCQCCGGDFSISEYDSIDEATRYHRTTYGEPEPSVSVEDYIGRTEILYVPADQIGK